MNRLSEVLISFISILLISIPLLFLTIYISLLYEPLRLFTQMRIGQYGKPFAIYKLQTMKNGKVTKKASHDLSCIFLEDQKPTGMIGTLEFFAILITPSDTFSFGPRGPSGVMPI